VIGVTGSCEHFLVLVGGKVPCSGACGAALGVGVEADNGAVDGAPAAGIVPVLRPVLLDRPSRPADVFEVGPAEVFVLLDVEPEVEDVLCALALEKEAAGIVSSVARDKKWDRLEHKEVDGRPCSAGDHLDKCRQPVCLHRCLSVRICSQHSAIT